MISFNLEARKTPDPTWQVMIDSSDLIAKVEFTTSGDFEAKAKVLTIYKGECGEKELLITGFSRKGVKVNHMSIESEYILFLRKSDKNYSVWTATSGFLKVDKKHVQYDLLQTTKYARQDFYSIKIFENFLQASIGNEQDEAPFHTSTLALLKKKILYPICSQYVMMLKLTGYREYNSFFLDIMFNEEPDARIALARYLGAVHSKEARENLVTLLNDKDEIVAEEAANELINFEPELAGDALLRKLKDTGNSNDLRKQNGTISQFKIKLVKSLVQLNYKPAVEFIIPMLQTKNKHLFNLTLDAVVSLGGKNYISYFKKHIEDNDEILFHDIFKHIARHKLSGGDSLMMNFLSSHDRLKSTGYHYLVLSKGLGVFEDSIVTQFVLNDFKRTIGEGKISTPKIQKKWVESYYDFFINRNSDEYKDSIYAITEKLIDFDFEQINTDTIFIDSVVIAFEPTYHFDLFLDYLSNNGDIDDLVFLHRFESTVLLNEDKRVEFEKIIAIIEKRLSNFEDADY